MINSKNETVRILTFINTLNYKKNEYTILGISLLIIFRLITNLSLSVTHGNLIIYNTHTQK